MPKLMATEKIHTSDTEYHYTLNFVQIILAVYKLKSLMPRAIAIARDAYFVDRTIGAKAPHVSRGRPAKQALALATEPRAKREAWCGLCHTCSPVTTFVQSENVAIAHLVGGVWPLQRFHLRMRTVLMGYVCEQVYTVIKYMISLIIP